MIMERIELGASLYRRLYNPIYYRLDNTIYYHVDRQLTHLDNQLYMLSEQIVKQIDEALGVSKSEIDSSKMI